MKIGPFSRGHFRVGFDEGIALSRRSRYHCVSAPANEDLDHDNLHSRLSRQHTIPGSWYQTVAFTNGTSFGSTRTDVPAAKGRACFAPGRFRTRSDAG